MSINDCKPTTIALRRRLDSLQSEDQRQCRICGCSILRDPDADRAIPACGTCKWRPEAKRIAKIPTHGFSETDISLIRKTHAYLPPQQLLAVLNDRLKADLGPQAKLHRLEELSAEIAKLSNAEKNPTAGWAALRKLLAQAKKAGTLQQITEQTITDFAVVFSLTPKELMRLKDILLQREDEEY